MSRAWVRELMGWISALGIALLTAAQVASTARAELLFRDGDSLIVALISRSLLTGGGDWALSSVLFLPESAVFTTLDAAVPLDVNGLLAVNAVLNILALYGAVRLVAGRRRAGHAPAAWSLVAVGAFCLLAVTETTASRDALELASLLLTTTYYSATVISVALSIGLIRRALDRPPQCSTVLVAFLVATSAVSTLTNPLFAAWATAPLGAVLAVLAVRSPLRRRMLALIAALVGGTVLGFLGRIPFSAWIANTGAGYAQPDQWLESFTYYGGLIGDRLATPLGLLAVALTLVLLVLAVVRTARADDAATRFVAAAAWVVPVLVLIGAVALGTHAARYLQPLAFAPLLALVAAPRAARARVPRLVGATAAVVLILGGAWSVPRLIAAASAPDADLTCVTDWIDASGRTGGGQFWTARLPKLHLQDPDRLVQVDHALNGYAWLVDRNDFAVGEVTFLVEDSQTVPWQLPSNAVADETIECGRYRILDFTSTPLVLGPSHS